MMSTASVLMIPQAMPTGTKSCVKPTKDDEISNRNKVQLTQLLTAKFENALENSGYGRDDQNKVIRIVQKNLLVHDLQLGSLSAIDGLSADHFVRSALQQLLTSEVRINSNEPVMLVSIINANEESRTIRSLGEKFRTILRDTFNIFPVRIYVARSHAQSTDEASEKPGFVLALLNVVNTEIGGPSMIQLLDNSHPCPQWDHLIFLIEAWHRTDLLWRHEKSLDSYHNTQKVSDEVPEKIPDVAQETLIQSESEVADEFSKVATNGSISSDNEIVESIATTEHPAMAELRAREASRPQIQHPSWDHIHSGDSLLDIIRQQAASARDAEDDAGLVEADVSNEAMVTKADDHGFELV